MRASERWRSWLPCVLACLLAVPAASGAQQEPAQQEPAQQQAAKQQPAQKSATDTFPETWGAIDPGKGVVLARSELGALNVSLYALARYINQLPASQTYLDHLGQARNVKLRQDFQLHRVLLSFLGWIYDPKFRYVVTVWTVNTTGQVNVVGTLSYRFADALTLGMGVNGLPGSRTMTGSHPFWLGTDRVMADEFFRPGFTSGLFASGELLPRVNYVVMLGNSLSQLGITANKLGRSLAPGGTVWWMPTTGEFGPRGAFGDYEWHQKLATRVGTSYTFSREDRFNQISQPSPDNTQIRLSDAVLLFETGALARDVTVAKADFRMSAVDAGLKYHGLFLQGELYHRWLNHFETDGPLPLASVYDRGYYIQAAGFPLKQVLELYAATSQIDGQFNDSWEYLGGTNWYPAHTRNLRFNLQVIRVSQSPVSSVFGYYTGGQSGTTVSFSSAVLF